MSPAILSENVAVVYEEVIKQLYFERDTGKPLWDIVLNVVSTVGKLSHTNYMFIWRDEKNVVRARAILHEHIGTTLYGIEPKCPQCQLSGIAGVHMRIGKRRQEAARTLKCGHCRLRARVAGTPAWLQPTSGGYWFWADYPYPSLWPTMDDISLIASS